MDHVTIGILIRVLVVASSMVAITVIIHFTGLACLLAVLRSHAHRLDAVSSAHKRTVFQVGILLAVVFGLFAMHTIEIWLYAFVFLAVQAAPDFETALYFSTVSYSSLGYGDVVLSREWRLLGAIEGTNGIILLGWSTAFFVSIIARMRMLEHDWTQPNP